MLRYHWWSGKIKSSEGYEVQLLGRETLVYKDGARSLCMGFHDAMNGQNDLSTRYITTSPDNDSPVRLSDEDLGIVVVRVVHAMKMRGYRCTVDGKSSDDYIARFPDVTI